MTYNGNEGFGTAEKPTALVEQGVVAAVRERLTSIADVSTFGRETIDAAIREAMTQTLLQEQSIVYASWAAEILGLKHTGFHLGRLAG